MNQAAQGKIEFEQRSQNRCWKILFLKKWHPQPTVQGTKYLFLLVSLLFIGFGIAIVIINSKIQEHIISDYEKDCKENDCTIRFKLPEKFKQPIFVFYSLDNFYQNHRRYIKSKSSNQLSGKDLSLSEAVKYCSPIVRNSDIGLQKSIENGVNLDQDAVANPCGLIAKSFFNDTYLLFNSDNIQVPINENGIAWPDDKGNKFKKNKNPAVHWIDPTNEHFIVWMRTSGLPNFRKLWGRIEQDLEAGEYSFAIQNNYPVNDFGGHKGIVLSNSGPFGGKNYFLAYAFIAVGIISFLIAAAFWIKQKTTGDKFGSNRHHQD